MKGVFVFYTALLMPSVLMGISLHANIQHRVYQFIREITSTSKLTIFEAIFCGMSGGDCRLLSTIRCEWWNRASLFRFSIRSSARMWPHQKDRSARSWQSRIYNTGVKSTVTVGNFWTISKVFWVTNITTIIKWGPYLPITAKICNKRWVLSYIFVLWPKLNSF